MSPNSASRRTAASSQSATIEKVWKVGVERRLWDRPVARSIARSLRFSTVRCWGPLSDAGIAGIGWYATYRIGQRRADVRVMFRSLSLGGTVGGCVVATLYALLCREQPALLLGGLTVAAGAAFALQKAHYASLTASITATVVLLVSLGKATPLVNAEHRIVATLIGGLLALLVATIIPHSLRRPFSSADRVGVRRRA